MKTLKLLIKYFQINATNPRTTPSVLGVFLLIFLVSACKNSENKGKCKYGKPQAIFTDSMPTVRKHFFQIKDETGVEMVVFPKDLFVEIEQSGCNEIKQQFTFFLKGDFKDATDEDWKTLSVKFFRDFAAISPEKLNGFNFWADAIENDGKEIKLAEPHLIKQDIGTRFVRIDKIVSPEKSTLVIQLSSKE